ncbi:putative membrane protein [Variovorax sp. GrIS 2.14]|uniref:DUF1345 domain-containing protein n=1 Tax=Variovorax sp. GrIS 2.14 TaxID=3071709 RepID=UPI0038F7312D
MRKHLSSTQGPQRLLYGGVVGLVVGTLAWPLDGLPRGLVGWCSGVLVYLMLAFWLAETCDAEHTRARAQALDQPTALILTAMLAAALVSVGVIVMLLKQVKGLSDVERAAHVVLGVVSLALSWLMIHTIYAFHYAHRYYQEEKNNKIAGAGLDFPGKLDPNYFDFMYFSYVVGMTSQVSDVQVTSREMRHITTVHSLLSFAFNMLVLALSINVVASAI